MVGLGAKKRGALLRALPPEVSHAAAAAVAGEAGGCGLAGCWMPWGGELSGACTHARVSLFAVGEPGGPCLECQEQEHRCEPGAPLGCKGRHRDTVAPTALDTRSWPHAAPALSHTPAGAAAAGSAGAQGTGHLWHGERVVAKLLAEGGEEALRGLIRRWVCKRHVHTWGCVGGGYWGKMVS